MTAWNVNMKLSVSIVLTAALVCEIAASGSGPNSCADNEKNSLDGRGEEMGALMMFLLMLKGGSIRVTAMWLLTLITGGLAFLLT